MYHIWYKGTKEDCYDHLHNLFRITYDTKEQRRIIMITFINYMYTNINNRKDWLWISNSDSVWFSEKNPPISKFIRLFRRHIVKYNILHLFVCRTVYLSGIGSEIVAYQTLNLVHRQCIWLLSKVFWIPIFKTVFEKKEESMEKSISQSIFQCKKIES